LDGVLTGYVAEQAEPLGQSVAVTDPEPPNEPTKSLNNQKKVIEECFKK